MNSGAQRLMRGMAVFGCVVAWVARKQGKRHT